MLQCCRRLGVRTVGNCLSLSLPLATPIIKNGFSCYYYTTHKYQLSLFIIIIVTSIVSDYSPYSFHLSISAVSTTLWRWLRF